MRARKILERCLFAFLALLAVVGFPLPVAPRDPVRPSQEQSQPADDER